ncbi:hypothetical protein C7447_101834 [Tenacibaculum adriaticum]|uniref:Uncharacterized protein n=1 Tax=Tenacibaculum adriaticum TaxID=413713 RepID=A0A5S5DWD0_9FLAO|nr:hypothetical protein [Tenacibaculum adriaticum]TYQ00224.1 hypothetical protein C7447_101834 [Tenacibaculum adriaticum]
MLTLEKCRRILEAGGKKYSDENVKKLREKLYSLAGVVTDVKALENEKLEE